MKLIDNAEQILRKAWSVKMALLTTLFATLEVILPALNAAIPPGAMAGLAAFTSIGGVVVRVLKQNGLSDESTGNNCHGCRACRRNCCVAMGLGQ